MVTKTREQLRALNIAFCSPFFQPTNNLGLLGVTCDDGVIFTGVAMGKGVVLAEYLSKCKEKPSLVIAVDDSKHNLDNMARAVESLELSFIGIHYTHELLTS